MRDKHGTLKPRARSLLIEVRQCASRRDLHDHVHVDGWTGRRRGWISDPKRKRCSADEDDLVEERSELVGRLFEELDAHGAVGSRRFLKSRVAMPR